jgi:hypothetical protein
VVNKRAKERTKTKTWVHDLGLENPAPHPKMFMFLNLPCTFIDRGLRKISWRYQEHSSFSFWNLF